MEAQRQTQARGLYGLAGLSKPRALQPGQRVGASSDRVFQVYPQRRHLQVHSHVLLRRRLIVKAAYGV
jgi:hypothetical protein